MASRYLAMMDIEVDPCTLDQLCSLASRQKATLLASEEGICQLAYERLEELGWRRVISSADNITSRKNEREFCDLNKRPIAHIYIQRFTTPHKVHHPISHHGP